MANYVLLDSTSGDYALLEAGETDRWLLGPRDTVGAEYVLPGTRLHYALDGNRPHYVMPSFRPHYEAKEEHE